MAVENPYGEHVGHVKDFLVDVQTGYVHHALVSDGGFLGLGQTTKVVPATAVSMATAKRGILALNLTRNEWKAAPRFRRASLMAGRFKERGGFETQRGQSNRPPVPGTPAGRVPPAAGRKEAPEAISSHETVQLERATDLLQKTVVERTGGTLGEVCDLVVDLLDHKPAWAMVTHRRLFKKAQRFAVPLNALKPDEKGRLVLETDTAKRLGIGRWEF